MTNEISDQMLSRRTQWTQRMRQEIIESFIENI